MPPIYLGDTPVTVFKGETQITSLAIGEAVIQLYTSFDYTYILMNLLHVPSIKNDIYGLHYDLIGGPTVVPEVLAQQSYTYESCEKTYSWY